MTKVSVPSPVLLPKSIDFTPSTPYSEGGYATVYRGTDKKTRRQVALKKIRTKHDEKFRSGMIRDAETWSSLNDENVATVYGVLHEGETVYLVSQFVAGGPVSNYLTAHRDMDRVAVVMGVTSGLTYLHSNGVTHGDLRADNVLMTEGGVAKLCDFGLRKHIGTSQSRAMSEVTRIRHLSPEAMMGSGSAYSKESDIYAYAMMVVEILSGFPPFRDLEVAQIIQDVCLNNKRPPTEPRSSPSGESYSGIWAVATSCWETLPERRISMAQALARLKESYPTRPTGRLSVPREPGNQNTWRRWSAVTLLSGTVAILSMGVLRRFIHS